MFVIRTYRITRSRLGDHRKSESVPEHGQLWPFQSSTAMALANCFQTNLQLRFLFQQCVFARCHLVPTQDVFLKPLRPYGVPFVKTCSLSFAAHFPLPETLRCAIKRPKQQIPLKSESSFLITSRCSSGTETYSWADSSCRCLRIFA